MEFHAAHGAVEKKPNVDDRCRSFDYLIDNWTVRVLSFLGCPIGVHLFCVP